MAFESPEAAQARFTEFFHETDTDKSGSLSFDEFKVMLLKGGYKFTDAELKVFIL
jgi:Ca2+-binding EF-hand superfamily protein